MADANAHLLQVARHERLGADGAQSVILPQVTFGIAVRMAVMSIIAGNSA
ncbi:MAG: hypothetical protein ACXWIZ_11910 [Caldimonas sp.]